MRYFKIIKESNSSKSTVYAIKEKQYLFKFIPKWEYLCEEENGFTKMIKEKMVFKTLWDAYNYLFDFYKKEEIDISYDFTDINKIK
jgi:hypothetical protein